MSFCFLRSEHSVILFGSDAVFADLPLLAPVNLATISALLVGYNGY